MFYLLPTPLNLSPGGIRLPVPARGSKLWLQVGAGGSGEAEGREDNAQNERNREKEREVREK